MVDSVQCTPPNGNLLGKMMVIMAFRGRTHMYPYVDFQAPM